MGGSTAPDSEHTAIVAIDFGTHGSGYAFAYTAEPEKVYTNRSWPRTPGQGKTLTAILLKRSDLSVVAFGYEAREKNAQNEGSSEFLYFANFKMTLHGTGLRGQVKASNCNVTIPTEQLISACIGVIIESALGELNTSTTVNITRAEIRWVVTVPAIWDTAARQVMAKAVEKAGIHQNNVVVALEPESAVLSCLNTESNALKIDLRGSTYMVVDAGGGTVDITVHRKTEKGDLVEVHSPSGGSWGSTYINANFAKLLEELFGKECVTRLKNTSDWDEIMDNFEAIKVKYYPGDVANINVYPLVAEKRVPPDTTEYNSAHGTNIALTRGYLRLAHDLPSLINPIIDNIITHVEGLLNKPELKQVRYLFLVGGFAESTMLQKRVTEKFGNRLKVVIPPRPGTAVIIGAVWFGINPGVFTSRIATQTIGVATARTWNEEKHRGRQMIVNDDGERLCNEILDVFARYGESVEHGREVKRDYIPIRKTQTSIRFNVYGSLDPNAEYHTDKASKLIGFLELEIPGVGEPASTRVVDVVMKFGGPNFTVTATYRSTGKSVDAKFSFPLDEMSKLSAMSLK